MFRSTESLVFSDVIVFLGCSGGGVNSEEGHFDFQKVTRKLNGCLMENSPRPRKPASLR